MERLRQWWRMVKVLAFGAAFFLAAAAPALAGEAKSDSGGGSPPYVGPYFLLVFALGLGLFAVCNPSRRRDRARPEAYEDKMAQKLKAGH